MKIQRIDKVKREQRVILDLNREEAEELRDFLDPQKPFVHLDKSSRLMQISDHLRRMHMLPVEEVGDVEDDDELNLSKIRFAALDLVDRFDPACGSERTRTFKSDLTRILRGEA